MVSVNFRNGCSKLHFSRVKFCQHIYTGKLACKLLIVAVSAQLKPN